VERLRARDDVRRAGGKARLLRVRLDETDVAGRGRLLGLAAHLGARLDAHDLVGPLGPGASRKPRPAAEVDDVPRALYLGLEAENVEQCRGCRGPVGVVTMRETRARIARSSQKLLGVVLDRIPRVVAQPRLSLECTPVSAAATAARARILPNGLFDLLRQLAIWFGFLWAYRYTRGVADRDSYEAFQNGLRVADVEHRLTGLWELSLQSLVMSSGLLRELTSWTYWHSQFTVLGLVMLWVYLRRNEAFVRFRNTLLLANLIGLVGFVLAPTAPPRLFPELGFVDTLAGFGINHDSAIVRADANPYAAMPSLHAADALIVGVGLFFVVRTQWLRFLWLLWPLWVWFAVMATGNHFWLDILAGIVVAAVAGAVVNHKYLRRRFARPRPVPA
jgi:hypothetical protein